MSSPNYIMVTVAACDATYTAQAFERLTGLVQDLRDKAGAVTARYGVVGTGDMAGNLVLFQGYEDLNGVDRAFGVYAGSSDYAAMMSSGSIRVKLRNIWKIEALQLEKPSFDAPSYGVLTLFSSKDLMLDAMRALVPVFQSNGAMFMRYGTLMTGSNVGKRLLGVTYPSMDAIEKTYDGLRASDRYQSMLAEVQLEMRHIVRFVG